MKCFVLIAFFSSLAFADQTIRISTLNIWALPAMPDSSSRSTAIGKHVTKTGSDIVLFQEAFTEANRTRIQNNSNLDVGVYFSKKKLFSSGIYNLSRYPVLSAEFFAFTLAGNPLHVWEPDPWAAKGVGLTNYELKDGRTFSAFNTHLMARWGRDDAPEDKKTPDRLNQLFEIFAFIVELSAGSDFAVGGDFNMRWFQSEYVFWTELTGLKGLTIEGPNNPFCTSCWPNSYKKKDYTAGQLDYIFVSPKNKITSWHRDFEEKFEKKPGKWINHSNHFGLSCNVSLAPDSPHSGAVQRQRTFTALIYLLNRLNSKYKNPNPDGSGKKSHAVERIAKYIQATSPNTSADPEVERIRARLNWYFGLFD